MTSWHRTTRLQAGDKRSERRSTISVLGRTPECADTLEKAHMKAYTDSICSLPRQPSGWSLYKQPRSEMGHGEKQSIPMASHNCQPLDCCPQQSH